jgi:hypothetical protein
MDVMKCFVLAFCLLFSGIGFAQEPVEGPITDAIVERMAKKQAEEMAAMEGRIAAKFGETIAALKAEAEAAKMERASLLNGLREWNENRVGLLNRMELFSKQMTEAVGRWTPLQNLVDRLTGLVWRLFWFVCVLGGLLLFLALVGLFLYSRLKGFVAKEISSLVPHTFKV